jgi:2-haloacid dehalogenase
MKPALPQVQAVLFDAYGTLFDVYSVALTAERLFPGRGEQLAQLWRDKQIEYSRLVSMGDAGGRRYRPFWELTSAALRFAAARLGLELSDADRERLLGEYRHLSAYPENRAVLGELKARGVPVGILSNGDPAMLAVAVKSAALDGLLDHVISVDELRCYKPDPRVYALGLATLQRARPRLGARQVLFVSSNGWDAVGATWFGFTTLWVNRAGQPPEQLDTEPARTGSSLRDVLGFFVD